MSGCHTINEVGTYSKDYETIVSQNWNNSIKVVENHKELYEKLGFSLNIDKIYLLFSNIKVCLFGTN